MPARNVSVTRLVAATLVTITTLLLVAVGVIRYRSERDAQWSRLRRVIATHADELSVALPLPVWNIDRDQIDHIIQGSAETPFIYAVVVEAASHKHIHVRDAQWRFIHSDKPFPPIDGMVVQQRPIVFSGQHVGTVSVYATPKFIAAELRRSAMSFAITVVLIDVLLVLCVYFVLHRMVLRPVVEIERYALAVSSGGGELAKPLPSGSAAELVSLQSSIESMVALLDRRYVELQEEMVLRFESEERFRTIFDSVNDIIIIYDPESGAILDVNARFCEVFGYTREEARTYFSGSFASGIGPYRSDIAIEKIRDLDINEHFTLEWQARGRDGAIIWFEVSLRAAMIGGMRRVITPHASSTPTSRPSFFPRILLPPSGR